MPPAKHVSDSMSKFQTSAPCRFTVRLVLSPFKIWFKSRRERSANSPLANFWSSLHPICLVQTLLDTCRITARSGPGGSISAGRGSHGDPWWHTYLASTQLMKHWLALSPPLVIVLTITVIVHKRNVNFLTDMVILISGWRILSPDAWDNQNQAFDYCFL